MKKAEVFDPDIANILLNPKESDCHAQSYLSQSNEKFERKITSKVYKCRHTQVYRSIYKNDNIDIQIIFNNVMTKRSQHLSARERQYDNTTFNIMIIDVFQSQNHFTYGLFKILKKIRYMHQKRLSTISKLSSAYNTGIKDQFLNAYYYKNTCQLSKKRNVLYNNYCQDLQKQYISLKIMSDFLVSKIKINTGAKLNFVEEFKLFIIQFFGIINEVSQFQIQYFHEIQFGEEEKLTNATHSFIQKLKTYETSQKQFHESTLKQKVLVNQIIANYQSIKKDSNDPAVFYNYKQMATKSKNIIDALQKKVKINQQIRKDLDEIFQNSEEFQKQIVFYRQSFLNNKYKVMRKLIELSKSGKSSLTQLIVYLFDCVTKKVNDFQNKLKTSSQGVIRSKHRSNSNQGDENLKLQDYIIHTTQQYNSMNQQLQQLLKYLSQALQGYSKRSKQNQFKKQIMQLLNKLYEADQCPNNQILDTLYLYNFFSMKISDIVTSIYSGFDNLIKLKNNVRKHAQITLALIRCNPYKDKSIMQKNNQKQKIQGNAQIQELLEQMSNDYPISIIDKVYKSFQQTLSYLKNYISTKFHKKKRHIQDSMQISHIQETVIKPQKRPSKNQIWLWGKWQNQNDYKLPQDRINQKQMRAYLAQFQQKISQGIQKDKYNCSLTNKKDQKGVLTVFDKYLKFQASNASFSLIIGLKDIEDVQIAVKVFNKVLVVTTGNGQLIFSSLINIQEALQEIQQAVTASGNSHPKQTRVVIAISEEQLAAIQQRKIKIKPQLPNLQQMKLVGELSIQNFSIDHIYDLIYSDKPIKVKGKQQSCFMAYVMKKGNASNYEATKYDSVGPKFYTHEQGINFINAPQFSCRTINYDVKLPPIPFMNPYAHNTQQCKMLWISNEQFQYVNQVKTTGAPGQGCFYVLLVDKVTKVDKNVKIQVFFRIIWTNSSSLKSFIQSKATQQTIAGIGITLKQIKKYVQSQRGTGKDRLHNELEGEKQADEDKQKQTQKSQLNVKISKLQNQNKYLIIGLLVVLILNIIFKLFSNS